MSSVRDMPYHFRVDALAGPHAADFKQRPANSQSLQER
jgi:hypothetical protein